MTTQAQEPGFEAMREPYLVGAPLARRWLDRVVICTLALALILTLHIGGSLYWVAQNQVLVGHDASEYLVTSIEYANWFTPLSPQSLFRAFTYPAYRTPALYIAAQPFLMLFGVEMDSAQLLNVLLLAGVILLTYALGRQLAGAGVGLFAALLVGLLPLMAAMARLYYTEMFLTATVALNLLALYRSREFTSRPWSLLWGISLGLGLLVKWTMPLYLWLPLLWFGWRSGIVGTQFEGLQRGRLHLRRALMAVALAALLSTAWFWPNRAAAQLFPLGNYLWVGWFLLALLFFYAQMQPSTPASNWWAAAMIALVIASLWYLPHSNFGARLLAVDTIRSQEDTRGLGDDLWRYARYIYQDHLGALAFWAIIPLAMGPWLAVWVRRRTLNGEATLLWLSMVGTLLGLLLLGQDNPRNLIPLLPAFAVLATIALSMYSRPLRLCIGAAWLIVLLVQWSFFTFDEGQPFYQRSARLWAYSDYAKPPAAGETDPGYWVAPNILATITSGRHERQSLGVLVNTHQVHRGVFRYVLAVEGQNVGIRGLTTAESTWADLLASQWVLTKDGVNHNIAASGLEFLSRIQNGDPLFSALYTVADRIPLPDGDTLSIYHRDVGPGWPEAAPERLAAARSVAAAVTTAWSRHAQLVYATPDLAVWVGMHDPARARIRILPVGEAISPVDLTTEPVTWLVVTDRTSEALETTLDGVLYRAGAMGDDLAALVIYGAAHEALAAVDAQARWGEMRLAALRSYPAVAPGQVLPVEMELVGDIAAETKASVRLVAADGAIIASNDFPIVPDNRFGLFVPAQTPPGVYQLALVVYDGVSLTPIHDERDATPTLLTTIDISS